jgi:hypothetical protein
MQFHRTRQRRCVPERVTAQLRWASRSHEFLDSDDAMVEYGLPLPPDIAGAIRIHGPRWLSSLAHRQQFAGGRTNQADHRAVGLAALDASTDAGKPLDPSRAGR